MSHDIYTHIYIYLIQVHKVKPSLESKNSDPRRTGNPSLNWVLMRWGNTGFRLVQPKLHPIWNKGVEFFRYWNIWLNSFSKHTFYEKYLITENCKVGPAQLAPVSETIEGVKSFQYWDFRLNIYAYDSCLEKYLITQNNQVYCPSLQ